MIPSAERWYPPSMRGLILLPSVMYHSCISCGRKPGRNAGLREPERSGETAASTFQTERCSLTADKGSQDESYTVTRQGTHGKKAEASDSAESGTFLGPDSIGIASQWLVAWPGSFRMEVLRLLKDAPELWN